MRIMMIMGMMTGHRHRRRRRTIEKALTMIVVFALTLTNIITNTTPPKILLDNYNLFGITANGSEKKGVQIVSRTIAAKGIAGGAPVPGATAAETATTSTNGIIRNNNNSSKTTTTATTRIQPRAFERWGYPQKQLPCYLNNKNNEKKNEKQQQQKQHVGFYFIKVPKCASTTSASVMLRVSRNVAAKQQQKALISETNTSIGHRIRRRRNRMCNNRVSHGSARSVLPRPKLQPTQLELQQQQQQQQPERKMMTLLNTTTSNETTVGNENYFVWSMVREPVSRIKSSFFYGMAKQRIQQLTPTDDDEKLNHVFSRHMSRHKNFSNFMTRYLQPTGPPILKPYNNNDNKDRNNNSNGGGGIAAINSILNRYDFIGVAERFDESIVALQMILGLQTSDVLYFKSKASMVHNDTHCYPIYKRTTPYMNDVFASQGFQNSILTDMMLYNAINESLDLTIEKLGRSKFEYNLLKLQKAKQELDLQCHDKVRFPCGSDGIFRKKKETDCLAGDWGCGFKCMDSLVGMLPSDDSTASTAVQ